MEKLKNKVMIVDDDETIMIPIEMSLQARGIDTVSFTDGEEALEYLRNNKVSVILLDYHMEPHINGDEFIKKLREFDNETIVYLQTAYSEELPALDMLEKYEIQGYIDKGKRDAERMQLIISALKQAQTLELVKEQKRQIGILEYRNEFFGKFLLKLLGEIRERSMIIGGLSKIMQNDFDTISSEEGKKYSKQINEAIGRLMQVANTLDIEELRLVKISKLEEILKALFEVDLIAKRKELVFKYENDVDIDCDIKIVIYILVELVEYLMKMQSNEIKIECIDNLKIKIYGRFEKEIIEKISDIKNKSNENIEIEAIENVIVLYI